MIMAIKVIREKEPGPGTLGKPELYALAIGQVIGAGVITLIVPAIKMTGYSAWLAYLIAIIMGFVMILPNVFVSSTVRMAGGNYSMLCGMAGPRVAGVFAFMYLTQCLSLSLFGASAAAYLGDIIPALSSPTARIVVGAFLLTFFFVVNLLGIDIMAKAQKIMTWLLIAALVLFAVVGIAQRRLPIFDFSDPNFLVNGWGITFTDGQISGGFTGAILLFVYSTQGYYMTTSYGRDAKNARRDIPTVLIMAVPTLIVLYVGVAMAGVGVMSLEEYGASTTLVFAAHRLRQNQQEQSPGLDPDLYVHRRHDPHCVWPVHHGDHQHDPAVHLLLCPAQLHRLYEDAQALPPGLEAVPLPHPGRRILCHLRDFPGRLCCGAVEVLPVYEPHPGPDERGRHCGAERDRPDPR